MGALLQILNSIDKFEKVDYSNFKAIKSSSGMNFFSVTR